MAVNLNEHWSLNEKRKLAQLLSVYPVGASEHIARKLKTKTAEQVHNYVEKVKYSVKRSFKNRKKEDNGEPFSSIRRAPLEHWLNVASDFVKKETFDCSSHFSKVMSVIGHLEEFPSQTFRGHSPPNYTAIYRYLSQILQGDRTYDMDHLAPLESAIVLDLLHSLMEVLSRCDTTVQRNIVCWKQRLIEAMDHNNHPYLDNLRKAAENDFSDFVNQLEDEAISKQGMYKSEKSTSDGQGTNNVATPGSSQLPNIVSDGSSQVSGSVSQGSSREPKSVSPGTNQMTESKSGGTSNINETEDQDSDEDPTPCSFGTQTVKRHKCGRKKKDAIPEIPITEIVMVMPPANCKIINLVPRQKQTRKDRNDGKYTSLNDTEEIVLQKDTCIVYNVETSSTSQFKDDVPTAPGTKSVKSKLGVQCGIKPAHKRKYETVQKERTARPSSWGEKRPKLYSLNPFCLPVSLLDLDS